jgi:hypothetical protein
MKVYQKIAGLIQAMETCREKNALEWYDKHEQTIFDIEKEFLPSGSGFDSGCTVNLDKSTPDKLVIECPYHCMNDAGYYDGWVYPCIIVTPSLQFDYDLRINWKGYNGKYKPLLSDYIVDCFSHCLDIKTGF